jgi:intracellular sulfur oxidation DsrE/DsrF family protein
MKLKTHISRTLLLSAIMAIFFAIFTLPAQAQEEIRIDVPVMLKQAKVVFNMDHTAFGGDTPVGLAHMTMMLDRFKQIGTEWKLVAVFHGDAGYMLLNDDAYNTLRKTKTGNPYKGMIENLIKQGAQIEECGVTMRGNKWSNANLLLGVKVNTGADGRIIQLVQEGYVMLQP